MAPGNNTTPPNNNPFVSTSSRNMCAPMPPQPSPVQLPTPPAPHVSVPASAPAPVYNPRSNLGFGETTKDLSEARAAIAPDAKPTSPLAELLTKLQAEKAKVLEELESVKNEHGLKSECLMNLSLKVEQLRARQGVLQRKQWKFGEKILLGQVNNALEATQKQITSLFEEINTIKQRQQELTQVADILGEVHSPFLSKSEDDVKSRHRSRSRSPPPFTRHSRTPPNSEESSHYDLSQIFEYYDSGSHWCEDCNAIFTTLPEFLRHLHDSKHSQSVIRVKRPWMKKVIEERTNQSRWEAKKVNMPIKGPEFLVPVNGYYCELCEEQFQDHIVAEEHLRTYAHNDKYKKYIDAHTNYEAVRCGRKAAKLTAVQEASCTQAEQNRRIAEQRYEAYEHSKAKKAKKDEEEEEDEEEEWVAERKRHTSDSSDSPPPSHYQKKTPEKKLPKNPAFGKFIWKPAENKTMAAVLSSRVEAKENEQETLSLKPKGFAIKLLRKPSALPVNALSPSRSVAQKSDNIAEKSETIVLSPEQKNMSSVSSAPPSPTNPSSMQDDFDLYYDLTATEEDTEDLITSEDQNTEAVSPPASLTPIRPAIPDVFSEDIEDSDMACEVPLSSSSHISGWDFMQSSYASSKFHGGSNRQPKGTQVTTPKTPAEDPSAFVTCDSD